MAKRFNDPILNWLQPHLLETKAKKCKDLTYFKINITKITLNKYLKLDQASKITQQF